MVDRVCVEPAVSHDLSVVTATGNDTLVYPHVDSCMSVTAFVSPGTLVGGHAGVFSMSEMDLNASKSLSDIIDRVLAAVGTGKITKVLFVGSETLPTDPGYSAQTDWKLPTQIAKFEAHQRDPKISYVRLKSNERASGVDVFVDLARLRLAIQDFVPDRSRIDTAAPTRRTPIYDKPFHAVKTGRL